MISENAVADASSLLPNASASKGRILELVSQGILGAIRLPRSKVFCLPRPRQFPRDKRYSSSNLQDLRNGIIFQAECRMKKS